MFKKFKKEKLDSYISESKELAAVEEFQEAIKKLKESIEYIRDREKDFQTRMDLIKEVEDVMDSIYEDQISYFLTNADSTIEENNFEKASEFLEKASNINNAMNDADRKKLQKEEINFAKEKRKIEKLIHEGITERKDNQLEQSLNTLEEALNKSEDLVEEESELVQKIYDNIDKTYSEQGEFKITEAQKEKANNNLDRAIEILEEGKNIVEQIKKPALKQENMEKIQDVINNIYAQKIEPLIQKGQQLVSSDKKEEAINTLQKAIKLKNKMYDSSLKQETLSKIGNVINPVLIEKIEPLIEKAENTKKEKNIQESISAVNEITRVAQEALNLIEKMAESKEKQEMVQKVSKLIDNTCSGGIEARKKEGLRLIEEKKFDKAISEMYSALSIAKKMTCSEEDNEKIDEIKGLVNKVYLAEINEMLEKAEEQREEENYEGALETYKESLGLTNKMYLSEETEQKVEQINNLIYDTELKGVVSKGEVSDEEAQFQEQINELKKQLHDAQSILDEDRKEQKIYDIKKEIDKVHSEQLNLFMEQAQQSAKNGQFDEMKNILAESLKIKDLIEFAETKKNNIFKILENLLDIISKAISQGKYQEGKQIINQYTDLMDKLKKESDKNQKTTELIDFLIKECDQLIAEEKYDVSFEFYEINMELTEKIQENLELKQQVLLKIKNIYKEKLNDKAFIEINNTQYDDAINYAKKALKLDEQYVTTHFNLGNAYDLKGEFDQAKAYYEKCVQIQPDFKEAWNNLGIIFQRKKNFSQAIEAYQKALDIDESFADAWYHMGNAYREQGKIDEAMNCYQKATNLNSENAYGWLFYGECYYQKDNYVEALKHFEKAISLKEEIKEKINPLLKEFKQIVDRIENKLVEIFDLKKLD